MLDKNILAIDCSAVLCLVALQTNSKRIARVGLSLQSHNEELEPLVRQILAEGDMAVSDLQALVVGQGPGSFTGLRIAYSFVMGLAFSLKIPVYQISSLKMLACEFLQRQSKKPRVVIALADARRGEFYAGLYQNVAGKIEALQTDCILSLSEVKAIITQYANDLQVVSLADISVALAESLPECQLYQPEQLGDSLLTMGEQAIASNPNGETLAGLYPNYLRAVAAKTIKERQSLTS